MADLDRDFNFGDPIVAAKDAGTVLRAVRGILSDPQGEAGKAEQTDHIVAQADRVSPLTCFDRFVRNTLFFGIYRSNAGRVVVFRRAVSDVPRLFFAVRPCALALNYILSDSIAQPISDQIKRNCVKCLSKALGAVFLL